MFKKSDVTGIAQRRYLARLVIIVVASLASLGGYSEPRKKLAEVSAQELEAYRIRSKGFSDAPGYVPFVLGQSGNQIHLFGNELSAEEIIELEARYPGDTDRVYQELQKLSKNKLQEFRKEEVELTRHMRKSELEMLKAEYPHEFLSRLNSDWIRRENARRALGRERPEFGQLVEEIGEMPYDKSHIPGVEYPEYARKYMKFKFWLTTAGEVIRTTEHDSKRMFSVEDLNKNKPMLEVLKNSVKQLKAKGVPIPDELRHIEEMIEKEGVEK